MKNKLRIASILILGALLTSNSAFALTILSKDEAKNYLGDAKTHFLSSAYVYGILSRSHRDSMHGRFSDGVFFMPSGSLVHFLKNKDGERKFVVGATDGRQKEPVTEEAWRQKIGNALSDDNPVPYVFLDDSKKEMAVLFTGNGTEVTGKINENSLLQVELIVEGARNSISDRRHRY